MEVQHHHNPPSTESELKLNRGVCKKAKEFLSSGMKPGILHKKLVNETPIENINAQITPTIEENEEVSKGD